MSEWFWKVIDSFAGIMLVLAFVVLVIFSANLEIKDFDLWFHIASGNYILHMKEIPSVDVFSCTIAGKPWINHEWLFQVLVYPVYKAFGIDGLVDLKVILVTMIFFVLLRIGINRRQQWLAIALLILVLLVFQMRLTLRPDLFSLLFFSLYVYMLSRYIDEDRLILWLFILQVLWSNIHGFFIFGPLIIFIGIIAELVKRKIALPFEWNNIGRLSDGEYVRLKKIFIVVLLACFFNPYGVEGVIYPVKVLFSLNRHSTIFFKNIMELQPPIKWDNIFSLGIFPYYKLLILISLLSFILNYRKIDISSFLLWLVFFIFSLFAIRNLVFFAITAYFVILANYQYICFDRLDSEQKKGIFLAFFYRFISRHKFLQDVRLWSICSICLKVWLIIWIINYIGERSLRGYFDFDKFTRKSEYGGVSLRNFPYKAVDFLVANDIKGNFFNDFNSGAYILGRSFPNIKVFIDGRTEVYGPEFFKEYKRIWEKGDKLLFSKYIKKAKLTGAFLNSVYVPAPANIIYNLYYDKDWVLVYFDYDAAIFLRNITENKKWIDKYAIDLKKWIVPRMDLVRLGPKNVNPYQYINRALAFVNLKIYDKAEQEAMEAIRIHPLSKKAYMVLGIIGLEKKDYDIAYENFRKAKLIAPYDLQIRYNLALSLYYLKDYKQAYKQCNRVLAEEPRNAKALFLMARIYAGEGKFDRCIQYLKEGLSIKPDEVAAVKDVADVLVKQDRFDIARDVYILALHGNEKEKEFHKKLSDCYRALGNIEMAEYEMGKAK